jgi:ABC-type antimicrobial peptide transport system permease subunit
MALGAGRPEVLRLIVSRGLGLVWIGVAIGVVAAVALTRFLGTLLFGVSPVDPATFTLVALTLVAVGWLACYLPAHRASRS